MCSCNVSGKSTLAIATTATALMILHNRFSEPATIVIPKNESWQQKNKGKLNKKARRSCLK